MVADDHPAMLTVVADVLENSGFDVVGRARNGAEALALVEATEPDVAVLDVRMPQLSGLEVAQRAAVTTPGTAVVFYTAYGDRTLFEEALAIGARGFVLKDAPLEDLVRAVERVADGEAYVDPVLAGAVVAEGGSALTPREREILSLLADGRSNEHIAAELHISPETVRTHVRNTMVKLEAETRAHAVATALRQSIIT